MPPMPQGMAQQFGAGDGFQGQQGQMGAIGGQQQGQFQPGQQPLQGNQWGWGGAQGMTAHPQMNQAQLAALAVLNPMALPGPHQNGLLAGGPMAQQPVAGAMGPQGAGAQTQMQGDPYTSSRWAGSLPASRRRVAPETYWKIRDDCDNFRQFMAQHYKGKKEGQEYRDLYNTCVFIDTTIELAHRQGGYPGVLAALQTDDRLEVAIARIGAQVEFLRTGSRTMLRNLQAGGPPGDSSVLPDWNVQSARELEKQEFQQGQRLKQQGVFNASGENEGRRPRRRPNAAAGGGAKGAQQAGGGAPKKGG